MNRPAVIDLPTPHPGAPTPAGVASVGTVDSPTLSFKREPLTLHTKGSGGLMEQMSPPRSPSYKEVVMNDFTCSRSVVEAALTAVDEEYQKELRELVDRYYNRVAEAMSPGAGLVAPDGDVIRHVAMFLDKTLQPAINHVKEQNESGQAAGSLATWSEAE